MNTLPAGKKQQIMDIWNKNRHRRDSGYVPVLPNSASAYYHLVKSQSHNPMSQTFGREVVPAYELDFMLTYQQTSISSVDIGQTAMSNNTLSHGNSSFANTQPTQVSSLQGIQQRPESTGGMLANHQMLTLKPIETKMASSNNVQFGQPSIRSSSVFGNIGVSSIQQQQKQSDLNNKHQSGAFNSLEEKTKPITPVLLQKLPQTVFSQSGSFAYETNKLLFLYSFSQLMKNHNMSVPENILEDSNFVSQFLEFLSGENINLPTTNVPKFDVSFASTQSKISESNLEE